MRLSQREQAAVDFGLSEDAETRRLRELGQQGLESRRRVQQALSEARGSSSPPPALGPFHQPEGQTGGGSDRSAHTSGRPLWQREMVRPADVSAPLQSPPARPPAATAPPSRPLTIEEQWRQSPSLRAEFADDFEIFQAYMRARAKGLGRTTFRPGMERLAPMKLPKEPSAKFLALVQQEWAADPALQAEFQGQFEWYKSYCLARACGLAERIVNRCPGAPPVAP